VGKWAIWKREGTMNRLSIIGEIVALCILVLLATSAYGQEMVNLTVNSAYGSPDPPVGVHSYPRGTVITVSVATSVLSGTGVRYACVGWKAKCSPQSLPPLGRANSVTFTIAKDTVLTWKWKAQYLLTLNVSPASWAGRIEVWCEGHQTPTDGYWDYKKVAHLKAVEGEGYVFACWSGDFWGIENPTIIIMNGPKSVIANFSAQVPVADFSGSPRSAVDPLLTVQFTDESTGNITSWEWDFDNDGIVDSTDRNPGYTYSGTGRWTVKLTVSGLDGSDSETKTDYVRICVAKVYVRTGGSDANDGSSWALAVASIQAGIYLAGDDWAVLVAKGTYKGTYNTNLDFAGKAVHLKGVAAGGSYDDGIDWVIDAENVSGRRAFIFQTGETAHSVVENLAIRGSNSNVSGDDGGGICCFASSPIIIGCRITNNEGVTGGGIRCFSSSPVIANCTIMSNSALSGGGIYCFDSSPRITNCRVIGNNTNPPPGWIILAGCGGGIACESDSSPTITNCTITRNLARGFEDGYGGGLYCNNNSNPRITNCTITNNSAPGSTYGGGDGMWCLGSSPVLNNTIVWSNNIYTDSALVLNYCDYAEIAGTGKATLNNCIVSDPLFVDAVNSNYRLQATSLCIDRGGNSLVVAGVTTDLDDSPRIVDGNSDGTETVDIGAYEYQPPAPAADFTGTPTSGVAPLTVYFTDLSTGSPTSWAWDFDNNGTIDSIEQNPSHTYNSPGTYTVKLTVAGPGRIDSETKVDYIIVARLIVQGTGTVVYLGFEGGFYGIVGDDGQHYDTHNLETQFPEFARDGLRVWFRAALIDGVCIHQWGWITYILEMRALEAWRK
jgi:PKD repeat protein